MQKFLNQFKLSTIAGILFFSFLAFAIEINDEVELEQYMNARYTAKFTRNANNLRGQLNKGTRAKVLEIKNFSSGNSGFFLEIKDGDLMNQRVWVHFNPRSPSLKLFNENQQVVEAPAQARDATTTRDVPMVRDPAAAASAPVVSNPNPVVNPNPAVPAPPDRATALPGLVDSANRSVRDLSVGGAAGCSDCVAAAGTDRAAAANPAVTPVASATNTSRTISSSAEASGMTNYFVGYDTFIDNAGSLSAAQFKARRFLALRAHMTNFIAFCERYSPSSNDANRWITKLNGMVSFLRTQDAALGGLNSADVILTSYANRASTRFSNLGPENACRQLRSDFEFFVSASTSQIEQYLSLAPANRRQFISR